MADLIQIAKSSNITVFTAAWCNEQSPRLSPATLTPAQSATVVSTYNAYRASNTTTTTTSNTTTPPADGTTGKGSFIGNIVDTAGKFAATQRQTGYMPGYNEEYVKVDEILNKIVTKQDGLNNLQDIGKSIVEGMGNQFELYLRQQTELLGIMNKGGLLAGEASKNFREGLTNASPELMRVGIGFEELANAGKQLVQDTGKFASLTTETWQKAGVAATAYVGTLSEVVAMIPEFTKVGIGAIKTVEAIENAGKRAMGVGLTSQKTTKDLKDNIGKLNEYGFKNGVDGLARMVMKATEFRMEMNSVFKVADTVMDASAAIDLSANLQVLGGAIGDLGDPLKMMYMATNNVEGLQDAIIGAASSLATYNSEQGRFEVTGANLRKAKAEADALGMTLGEFSKIAIAAGERGAAAGQLMASGLQLDEEQRETITNLAQMGKGGKMEIALNSDSIKDALGVSRDSKSIAIENLTQAQSQTLLKYQDELKEKTPEEIVRGQATAIGNMEKDLNFIVALLRVEGGKTAEAVAKAMGDKMGFTLEDKSKKVRQYATEGGVEIQGLLKEVRAAGVSAIKDLPIGKSTPPTTSKVSGTNLNPAPVTTTPAVATANGTNATNNGQGVTTYNGIPYQPIKTEVQFSLKGQLFDIFQFDRQKQNGSYV